ncbi:hypothetical protein VTK73DRAFT_1 [Phialemonium thermophilum]|uniref:Uncharacterized protein n=1 Tax=Phialemonium thermophilum TaxID=223376 RepID=A0ABR3Y956_9PEZI
MASSYFSRGRQPCRSMNLKPTRELLRKHLAHMLGMMRDPSVCFFRTKGASMTSGGSETSVLGTILLRWSSDDT